MLEQARRSHVPIRYSEIQVRQVLNRCNTPRMPDCWTINPYRGCSFGCTYCYARYTHEFLGFKDPLEFERHIFVKREAPQILAGEATARRLQARPIAIGTATDPYQPAEAEHRITRGILEVLSGFRGLRISITTKSALITRDLDLLKRILERSRLRVHVSLLSLDRALVRQLDPRAPTPARRLRTVAKLSASGIPVGVNAMPVLPGLNDGEAELLRLFRAAGGHGASWVIAAPVFLWSASRDRFLSWLKEHRPERVALYRRLFARGIDIDPAWRMRFRELLAAVREETGMPSSPPASSMGMAQQLGLPGLRC